MTSRDKQKTPNTNFTSRRGFIAGTASALVAGGLASRPTIARAAHVANDETLRVGLVGCGGRGSGAARQALAADPNTKLVAMGDAFEDRLTSSLKNLKATDVGDRVTVDRDHRFFGFDAYQRVIESDVDVVLLATPPHFRPLHLKACIDADKHVFAEKPVAVDAPGIRSVLATAEVARKKNLSLVSGLCWRYETGMRELVRRIHDGALGDIVSLQSMRYHGGVSKLALRTPEMTDMQWQMRNWYYFTWLSGDFITEQFVHELDKQAWVLGDRYPTSCTSTGGRQTRIGEEYGNIYDHFATVFEYDNGVKYFATTRHQRGCSNPFYDTVAGTKGSANLMKYTITGQNPWRGARRRTDMHQLEHNAMYAALRKGETINNGQYMAKSTMMAIMARMSAYTGQTVTWQQAMDSKEDLSPPQYDWELALPVRPIAMPGLTQFA